MDPRLCSSSQTFFSCIDESESLTSNSAQASTRTSISIHHSPTLHPYPSLSNDLLPHPTHPAPCYFPQFPPAWLRFGRPSHVHVTSTAQIQTARNNNQSQQLWTEWFFCFANVTTGIYGSSGVDRHLFWPQNPSFWGHANFLSNFSDHVNNLALISHPDDYTLLFECQLTRDSIATWARSDTALQIVVNEWYLHMLTSCEILSLSVWLHHRTHCVTLFWIPWSHQQ